MKLTAEQEKVARSIVRIGRRRGESAKEIKAALETGLVEAGLRNPNYGDRDSVGWRQERSHYGSAKERLNLKKSINRFYDETSAVEHKYGRAGALAQAVQRSAFPGKYEQRSGDAQRIMRALDSGSSPSGGGSDSEGSGDSDARRQAIAQYILDSSSNQSSRNPYAVRKGSGAALLDLAVKLKQADETQPEKPSSSPARRRSGGGGLGGRKTYRGKPLHENFYRGPGGQNVDEGRKVGRDFVSGHETHDHVASDPKTIVKLGRLAERMGLTVREHPKFDPVDPVHTKGSFHYRNMAIDVSGDPDKLRRFNAKVNRLFGVR